MNPLVGYEPGTSPLHRVPAGVKLVAMFALAVLVVLLGSPLWLGVICVLVVLGYFVAGIPARRALRQLRAIVVLVVVVFAVQWWLLDPVTAAVVCLRIAAALGAANLFTATTRIEDLVSTVERAAGPLRRFGARPERIGLLAGLTLQAVAALSGIAGEVREAARARGADRSPTAFVVPFLVRTLRHADELGEALAARGEGD
ncbi:energy-coupling factor transporter transmembrane protein EcfT [Amycolatopsis acidicola]|uniref:Energy-coupling factor transporter transmembrane protein EcfT n=1 Tax=Amycolatopsis acidicola TaxID=2596893 RepID=A0A5N0URN6_9PSEU|nr:energy-coupling factor transporter transmembrane protein EcfT [Amycolatopsis acidicola]KAA9154321.1 energy-coupling factor transporter transmembrane protein EcfT [Amycolatopsis acidicola]